ncbi:MAG: OmpA family protein [Bacteroidales bacterium]|nr:OmpA family protein [Bacteroidales bacterium]
MKKSAILSLACAALVSTSAIAAVPEITYAEDPAQGVLVNRFKDNWFISAEGGVNVQFSKADKALGFGDRIAPTFGIQGGKWFSPVAGLRFGVTYLGAKGVSNIQDAFGLVYDKDGVIQMEDKYYKTHVGNIGLDFDFMLNITNWWCGYKPNRVYNFIAYVGAGSYFGFHKNNEGSWTAKGFDTSLALRGGIINSFNVSKQVALSLDIRYTALGANREAIPHNCINSNVSALIGVTYLFNNRTWNAPIVPVIPVIEDCDPIKARLAECEARLQDTQRKLDECLRRPIPEPEVVPCNVPVATCYFRIGSSTVSSTDRNVLKSVASVMKADTNVKYEVCGWADNYTGTDAVNQRIRTKRAEAVKKILVKNGVDESQLDVTTNPGDRYEGKENVYLDRCVTIQAK